MRIRTMGVRTVGAAVIFFAVVHLFINLYIMIAHFTMEPDKFRGLVAALSKVLGLIAVPEEMGIGMSSVKILASLLFLTAGAGIMALKEWSRKPLISLLVLRLFYGIFICVYYKTIHPHLGLIFLEFILLTYYLTRPVVKAILIK